jgi:hypothetical protein
MSNTKDTDTISIVLGDDPLDITMDTTTLQGFADDIVTVDFNDISTDHLTLDIGEYDNTLTIGTSSITEEKIKLLDALIEAIDNLPEDNELRSLFDNVRMLNKLKNAD